MGLAIAVAIEVAIGVAIGLGLGVDRQNALRGRHMVMIRWGED